jgi:hypothetical protein
MPTFFTVVTHLAKKKLTMVSLFREKLESF